MISRLATIVIIAFVVARADGTTCEGKDPCKACHDCSQCAYCTSGKGSCGVMRWQTNQQREKARKQKAVK